MNVFKRGDEMLRRVILLESLPSFWRTPGSFFQTQMSFQIRRNICAVPHLWHRSTLQRLTLNRVRFLCRGVTRAPHLTTLVPQTVPPKVTERREAITEKSKRSFHVELEKCLSPSDILDLSSHSAVWRGLLSSCLMRMWETTKKMSDEQRRCELQLMLEHPQFEALCHHARTDGWRSSCDDVAYMLLALTKLGVSHRSLVVQTLLRVVQERLNQFDDKSLSILAACLEEMESSKNADAVKQGLKLLLEERVQNVQNVVHLQTMMRLLGKDAPLAVKKTLEMKALSLANDFTLPNAQYMVTTLASLRLSSKPLLDICSKTIAENVHDVPFARLMAVLKSCRELRYRSCSLFSSISDHLANMLSLWTNKQVILVLLEFSGLGFRPAVVLDAIAERVIQNPENLTLKDLLSLLKVYSSLNHHVQGKQQEFLAAVTHALESYLPKMSSRDLLEAVRCLCVFEFFPPSLLEKLLQSERLNELLPEGSSSSKAVESKLKLLDVCLRLDQPPLPCTLSPIPNLPGFLCQQEPSVNPGLLQAVTTLVGEDAVKEAVVEEGVYFIDCVVTLTPKESEVAGFGERQSGAVKVKRR